MKRKRAGEKITVSRRQGFDTVPAAARRVRGKSPAIHRHRPSERHKEHARQARVAVCFFNFTFVCTNDAERGLGSVLVAFL